MNIKGSIILVTGATGSFGGQFITQLKDSGIKKLIVYSRDELKQHDMAVKLKNFPIDIEFIVGDIRDKDKIMSSMKGVEYVVHAAALKQVPTGENFPEEIIRTNILGTMNVVEAAEYNGVSKLVSISTDKAAYSISCYGAAKLISERIIMAQKGKTINVCLRYGNVLGSRGSVVPLWLEQIRNKRPLTITQPTMTRFILNLNQAVELAKRALFEGRDGDLFVMKPDACSVQTLAESLDLHFGRKLDKTIIGIRNGEKLHETLLTSNEAQRGSEEKYGDVVYVRVPVNANKDFYDSGNEQEEPKDFTSLDAKQLTSQEVLNKLIEANLL